MSTTVDAANDANDRNDQKDDDDLDSTTSDQVLNQSDNDTSTV